MYPIGIHPDLISALLQWEVTNPTDVNLHHTQDLKSKTQNETTGLFHFPPPEERQKSGKIYVLSLAIVKMIETFAYQTLTLINFKLIDRQMHDKQVNAHTMDLFSVRGSRKKIAQCHDASEQ
jgi:hypothetical protein